MMRSVARNVRGFTLLELIVAVGIFAIVSAVAFGGLNSVLTTQSQTREHAQRLSELQRAMMVIATDFEQTVGRSVRDQYGDTQPAMQTNVEGVIFTRAGQLNPMGQARSAFERVSYLLNEDDHLVRRTWPGLDLTNDPQPRDNVLLKDVDRFTVSFVADSDSEWTEEWPPAGVTDARETLPAAVRVTLAVPEVGGELKRILRVP